MMTKQIVAIGGGGFGRHDNNLKFENYLLKLIKKPKPKILFLPQASGEDPSYIIRFYQTCQSLSVNGQHLSLFGRVQNNWQQRLLNQDIIYVGGGNTKSMLALWKAWGVDTLLKQAYAQGTLLCGVSAGAICWFEQGITDSVWPLGIVTGLGLLPNSFCPHYDSEPERQRAFPKQLTQNQIKPGYALEDNTAAHFIDGQLHKVIITQKGQQAFYLTSHKQTTLNTKLI